MVLKHLPNLLNLSDFKSGEFANRFLESCFLGMLVLEVLLLMFLFGCMSNSEADCLFSTWIFNFLELFWIFSRFIWGITAVCLLWVLNPWLVFENPTVFFWTESFIFFISFSISLVSSFLAFLILFITLLWELVISISTVLCGRFKDDLFPLLKLSYFKVLLISHLDVLDLLSVCIFKIPYCTFCKSKNMTYSLMNIKNTKIVWYMRIE